MKTKHINQTSLDFPFGNEWQEEQWQVRAGITKAMILTRTLTSLQAQPKRPLETLVWSLGLCWSWAIGPTPSDGRGEINSLCSLTPNGLTLHQMDVKMRENIFSKSDHFKSLDNIAFHWSYAIAIMFRELQNEQCRISISPADSSLLNLRWHG
jgi:hypothetical protein